jgi:hypothetical protein
MQSKYPHKTYILRVWQTQLGKKPVAIASLNDCYSSQQQTFANLEDLLAYLEAAIEERDQSISSNTGVGNVPE